MGLVPLGILASASNVGCELLVSLRPWTRARRLHVFSTRNVAIVDCNTADVFRCRERGRNTRPALSSEITQVRLLLALLLNVKSRCNSRLAAEP